MERLRDTTSAATSRAMRAMGRALLAAGAGAAAAAVAACGPVTAPPSPARVSNAALAAPPARTCDLGWLESVESLTVTELLKGPRLGTFELRATLRASGGELAGVALARYTRPGAKASIVMQRDLRIPRPQIDAALAPIARESLALAAAGRRAPGEDSGLSIGRGIETWGRSRAGVESGGLLRVEGEERHPQQWSLEGEGCELTDRTRDRISRAYARLRELVRRDEILAEVQRRPPP
jgi:hypothetical protein